jgi:hypothetical protein
MARLCSERPARFHGLDPKKGGIRLGADADFCVLERGEFVFDERQIRDREDARWSPYHGRAMKARVAATCCAARSSLGRVGGEGAARHRPLRPPAAPQERARWLTVARIGRPPLQRWSSEPPRPSRPPAVLGGAGAAGAAIRRWLGPGLGGRSRLLAWLVTPNLDGARWHDGAAAGTSPSRRLAHRLARAGGTLDDHRRLFHEPHIPCLPRPMGRPRVAKPRTDVWRA